MAALNEFNFVEKLTEDIVCSICTGLLKDPVLTDCCGQNFCDQCLKTWLQKQPTCPHCRAQDFNHINYLPKKRLINALKIYCPNHSKGCEEIITVSECSTHLETCLFERMPCTNSCGVRVLRKQLQNHTANECLKRKVNCQYCNQEGMYKEITAKYHLSWCPSFPLDCPNNCGPDKIQRKDLSDHQKECPLEPVKCPFFEAGCKQEIPRKELAAHKASNTENHLELMMITTTNALSQLKTVTHTATVTQNSLKQVSLKFDGLASCMTKQLDTINSTPQNATAINNIKTAIEAMTTMLEPGKQYCLPLVSTNDLTEARTPSFYIKPGYKMYINSYYRLVLEKGEYDERLRWPMPEMEIELHTLDPKDYLYKIKICGTCGCTVNKMAEDEAEKEIKLEHPFIAIAGKHELLIKINEHQCYKFRL